MSLAVNRGAGESALSLPDRDAPVLMRDIIYTAVTRARKSVTV